MTIKCRKCGLETDAEDAFVKYCPPCVRSGLKIGVPFIYCYLFIIYIFTIRILFSIFSPAPATLWLLLNGLLTFIFIVPMTLLHELAHFLSARLLGLRVFKITLGMGKTIFQRRLLATEFEWKVIPIGGSIQPGIPPSKHARLKLFLAISLGPMTHVLIASFLIILFSFHVFSISSFLNSPSPLTALLFCNLYLGISNLLPRRTSQISTIVKRNPSDGLQLFRIPFLSDKEMDVKFSNYYAQSASEKLEQGQIAAAFDLAKKGVDISNDNPTAIFIDGVVLDRAGDYVRARKVWSSLLDFEVLSPTLRFLTFNNLAGADIMIGDQNLIDEADQYSSEAIKNLPWIEELKGTRGAVLVEMGYVDEGLEMLLSAKANSKQRPENEALLDCMIAIAEKRKGNGTAAENYLQLASQLDPDCPMIDRARNEDSVRPNKIRNSNKETAFDQKARLSELEKAMLDWFKDKFRLPGLSRQIENVEIGERQQTDDGVFISLIVPDEIPELNPNDLDNNPLIGPRIIAPEIDVLNESRLSLSKGRLESLQIFSSVDEFPKNIGIFELIDP
ncbi:MAG: site-2 protease family protein [Thermoleophilia bacterium]